jgi:hypothetical protein
VATRTIEPPSRTDERRTFLQALEAMGVYQRLAICRSGGFTRRECSLWAANFPEAGNRRVRVVALPVVDLD